jgi:radial spoke head protein 9
MEFVDLEQGLRCVASAGHVLNYQELTSLQAALIILRNREQYEKIYFWGKIFGEKADYYIACGFRVSDFEFPSKNFYVACECKGVDSTGNVENFEFQVLPRLTEEVADRLISLGMDSIFTGMLSSSVDAPANSDATQDIEQLPPLTEMDRLSQVVQEIDFDTSVVPKGAYLLNEAQRVVPNSDFKGLGPVESTLLSSYVHFRPPTSVASLRALAKTDAEFYANFLDPVKDDLPKGCWACRPDSGASLVTLRSLSWPGYISYHVAGAAKFGGVYFGYGRKNRDLPFIL